MATISKGEYKVTLMLLKFLPCVTLLLTMLCATLIHFNVATAAIWYVFLSPSIFSLVMTIMLSKLFKFCYVHRLPIYWMIIGKFLLIFTGDSVIDLVAQGFDLLMGGGAFCLIYTIIHLIFGNWIRNKLNLNEDENCISRKELENLQ